MGHIGFAKMSKIQENKIKDAEDPLTKLEKKMSTEWIVYNVIHRKFYEMFSYHDKKSQLFLEFKDLFLSGRIFFLYIHQHKLMIQFYFVKF